MPRFDEAALRRAAGPGAYDRGAAYARAGRVRLISVTAGAITAAVIGTEVYATEVMGAGAAFGGDCECQAFADAGFCKHLVAVALVVNNSPEQLDALADRRARMIAYLGSLDHDALVGKLLVAAERDQPLWRQLELEASLAGDSDDVIYARLAEAIDRALDVDEYVDWRGAGALAATIAAVTQQVERVLNAGRPAVALRALDRLLGFANGLFQSVDDSEGQVTGAFQAAQELHLEACVAARPDPLQLAASLFERELNTDHDLWTDAHGAYADALGESGVAEFRRLAQEAWRTGAEDNRLDLLSILDDFAKQEGNIDARVELRLAVATDASGYRGIAEICLEAGRKAEALRWAEEGLWKFEDKPDKSLILFTADLHQGSGDRERARDLLWSLHEREPSLELHQRLKQIAANRKEAVERSLELLRRLATNGGSPWPAPADLLIDVLTDEGRLDDAWASARQYGCGEMRLETLARLSEASHPDLAIEAFTRIAERQIGSTVQSGYEGGIRQIARIDRLRAGLGRTAEQAAYLADLAQRHKMKRNFIKLLTDRRKWPKG